MEKPTQTDLSTKENVSVYTTEMLGGWGNGLQVKLNPGSSWLSTALSTGHMPENQGWWLSVSTQGAVPRRGQQACSTHSPCQQWGTA